MAIVVNSNSNSNNIEKQDTNILTKKLVNNINSYLLFQFLMVRLKVIGKNSKINKKTLFQFLMVRLKGQ